MNRQPDAGSDHKHAAARLAARSHPEQVYRMHERLLADSSAQARMIELGPDRRMHVVEKGDGPPLVLIHGSRPSALLFLPLLEQLRGVRTYAVDRPGFGLSDPLELPSTGYREATVSCLAEMLDGLGVDRPTLLGHSMGGTWALWYALAHPERVGRIVLLGATPLLPGTSPPLPLRLISTRGLGRVLVGIRPNSAKTLLQDMAGMGEKDAIVAYPDQIEALVTTGSDPVAVAAIRAELHAIMSLSGFRPSVVLTPAELGRVAAPVLMIWGERDPLGGEPIARAAAEMMPDARLEVVPTGHIPWLGRLDQTAALINGFVG